MLQDLIVTIGAGLAGMLLFLVSTKGTVAAIFMTYFAPLPIMIAALGWRQLVGLAAALFGAAVTALLFDPVLGLIYAATSALPAWWLGYLALLGQSAQAAGTARLGAPTQWYPIGRLVGWAALIETAIIAIGIAVMSVSQGGLDKAAQSAASEIVPMLTAVVGADQLPPGARLDDIAAVAVRIVPVALAALLTFVQLFNLWLAGRIVEISKRLARPWPSLPENLRLPRPAALVFPVALAATLTLRSYAQMVGAVAVGAFAMALALDGLAAIHAMSRGRGARPAILAALYAALATLTPWMMALLAVFGLVDSMLSLRDRARPAASGQPRP